MISSDRPYRAPRFEERLGEWLDSHPLPRSCRKPGGFEAPLSFAQEAMWFHALVDSTVATYNEYDAIAIDGPLDTDALARAVQSVAERHDAFRLTFPLSGGKPVMRYLDEAHFPFAIFDESANLEASSGAWVHEFVRRATREPFDLKTAAPARATLLRLGPERHVLLLVIHHIIKDGTTEGVIADELSRFYAYHRSGRDPELPRLTVDLADFAVWQRELAASGALRHQSDYWASELRDVVPAEIPGDRPRPAVLSNEGAKVFRTIPPAITERLREIAHEENASLFVMLMTALSLLLHRYSGRDDAPVAFPVQGRMDATLPMAGNFINSLVFRGRFDRDRSFRELLRASCETIRTGLWNQDVPLMHVAERVAPARSSDRMPFAAASMILRNPRKPKLALDGCRTARIDVDVGIAKFDLFTEFEETTAGLLCKLEYRTSLYDAAPMQRFLANFETLVRAIAADPDRSFRHIPILAPEEAGERERRSAGTLRPLAPPVHETIAGFAREFPDAVAVVDGKRSLTYRELDDAAERVARYVATRREGCAFVAVVAVRSWETIAAILGILKAGLAYLPLDATYPRERRQAMLADSGASLVLAFGGAGDENGASSVAIAQILAAGSGDAWEAPRVALDDLAYLMYTSGSTGEPNGVMVEHRALANYVQWFSRLCALGPRDRVLQFASLSFDISVEEMFGALTGGAALVLTPDRTHHSVSALLEHCERTGVTVLDLPTAYFHEVAAALHHTPSLQWPQAIRLVIVGGEGLQRDHAEGFVRRVGPNVRLINSYGPTETTIAVTAADVTPALLQTSDVVVPLGTPIDNIGIELLDAAGEPVPLGAIGRINVTGAALARGYHRRSELTARRFRAAGPAGSRAYDTGDLGRWGEDGLLHFCGRSDQQVKVRGFRVEPGEVETALRADARVRDAAVLLTPRGTLAAGIVSDVDIDAADLRTALADRLPPYALPDEIVRVDAVPLNANGKRDPHALLRLLDEGRSRSSVGKNATVRNATLTEARLIAIWEELLGRAPIGLDDDFFAAGGHSLLAARMFAAIELEFGRRLPLAMLLSHPTVTTLAEALVADTLADASLLTVHAPERRGMKIFFMHADFSGAGLYVRWLARELRVDSPVYAFSPHGLNGGEIPPTVEAMARDYLRSVRSIQPHGPYLLGGHCLGAIVAIEMARQLREAGEVVADVVAIEPPSVHFVIGAILPKRVAPETASRTARGVRFTRLAKRLWRWVDRLADPKRRDNGLRAVTKRWHRYVLRRPLPPQPRRDPWRREEIGDAQIEIADGYIPSRYDGPIQIVRARDSERELAAVAAWRAIAPNARIHTVPGAHLSVLTRHPDALADRFTESILRFTRRAS